MLLQIFRTTQENGQTGISQQTPAPKLNIVGSNITNQSLRARDVIKITFDRPVNNESLNLEITPQEEILPSFNQSLTELSIEPANAWNYDTEYLITILKSTKSTSNLDLGKDYQFKFKTVPYSGI